MAGRYGSLVLNGDGSFTYTPDATKAPASGTVVDHFTYRETGNGLGAIANLPPMRGKLSASFCTFALNPGKSLDKLDTALRGVGTDVIGGLALHRAKLEEHTEEFAARLVANVPTRA